MKTEDILGLISLVKNKTVEVKLIMDDIQDISERMSTIAKNIGEVAKLVKNIVQKVEEIKK